MAELKRYCHGPVRWEVDPDFEESPEGDVVLYSDAARIIDEFTARVRELEAECARVRVLADFRAARLATSSALLEEVNRAGGLPHELVRRIVAHISAQPPAPEIKTDGIKKREPGCDCDQEEGDSPCVVHGLYEAEAPADHDRVAWRTGTKNPHTLYEGYKPVGCVFSPEDGPRVAARLNSAQPTYHDRAVLEAAAAIHPRALRRPLQYVDDWQEFVDAELARREASRG